MRTPKCRHTSRPRERPAGTPPVNANIILAVADGVVTTVNRTLLKKNEGTIEQHWGFTQAKAKLSHADIAKLRLRKFYLLQIKERVDTQKTLFELVISWGQAGVKLSASSNWILEQQEGAKRVEIAGPNDKSHSHTCRYTLRKVTSTANFVPISSFSDVPQWFWHMAYTKQ